MRKLLVFIIGMMLFLQQGQAQKDSVGYEKFNLKSVESIIDTLGRKIDVETKALRTNRNEYFKLEAKSADSIAMSYLRSRCNMYGLDTNLNGIRIRNTAKI